MAIEHRFGDLDKATRKLSELGFSLEESKISGKALNCVYPRKMGDDYPMTEDGITPRAVAFVFFNGTLMFVKPYDENSVLMAYQETLREELIEKIRK